MSLLFKRKRNGQTLISPPSFQIYLGWVRCVQQLYEKLGNVAILVSN